MRIVDIDIISSRVSKMKSDCIHYKEFGEWFLRSITIQVKQSKVCAWWYVLAEAKIAVPKGVVVICII